MRRKENVSYLFAMEFSCRCIFYFLRRLNLTKFTSRFCVEEITRFKKKKMERVECPRKRKFLYCLLRVVNFICDKVPSYQSIFSDERRQNWNRLSRNSLDRILERLIRHTPCHVLSLAFYEGILTSHTGILRTVGSSINKTTRRRAKCLQHFLSIYERK